MKKRIIRTLATMVLVVSVIMPGAQGLAQEMQFVEMRSLGELTDAGDKLKKEEWDKIKTFRGWGHEIWKCGDYTGFLSNDKKAFWINGIKISADTVEVRIPSEINGIKVTKIGAYDFNADYCSIFERFPYEEDKMSAPAYRDGRNITKIVVPEGVKVIGQNTFAHMKNLKRVSLPQSVTALEHNVFYKDNQLQKVNIAAGNKTFKAKKNVIYSKNGKSLYLIYGKVKSITIDAKVRQIVNSESHKVTNNIGALARGIKVFIHKKNKVFGAENGFVYLKKTGELLYYANKSKDPILPKSIKKITKKTYWCTSYINKFTLSKNVRYVNGNYLPVREGYLRKPRRDRVGTVVYAPCGAAIRDIAVHNVVADGHIHAVHRDAAVQSFLDGGAGGLIFQRVGDVLGHIHRSDQQGHRVSAVATRVGQAPV